MQDTTERKDVYSRITAQIVEHLEKGVRPWIRPWNAEHAAGRITRPLRHNGQPYSGINILSLWMSALGQSFTAPIWMTFHQANELNAHVRKGEKGSLVVYANAITRTERDDKTGEDVEREIPFMKGYSCEVFGTHAGNIGVKGIWRRGRDSESLSVVAKPRWKVSCQVGVRVWRCCAAAEE